MTFEMLWHDIQFYKLVTNVTKDQIQLLMHHSNGCGSKGGFQFPSTMWGVNIEAACNIHDIEWYAADSYEELLEANERFDNNLKKICDTESNTCMAWIRRMRIAKYISGVEIVGTHVYAVERGFIGE